MAVVGDRIRTISVDECPKCLSSQTEICDSRMIKYDRIRKRRCLLCGCTWKTKEVRL